MKKKKSLKKYGWGSTIGGVLGTVAGSLIAPGVGTGIGASAGAALGSMFDEQPSNNTNQMKPVKALSKNNIDLSLFGTNTQMFDLGGMLYEPNAEIEGGEVAITPDGNGLSTDGQDLSKISSRSFKSNGSKHSNGGHEVKLPEGTMIASDQITNPLTGKTFAKDIEKQERAKGVMEKRLKNRPEDRFVKEGIKLAGKKADKLFNMQETLKENLMLKETMNYMAKGGLIKYDGLSGSNIVGGNNLMWNNPRQTEQDTEMANTNPVPESSLTKMDPYQTNNNFQLTTPTPSSVSSNQEIEQGFDYGKYAPLIPAAIGTGLQFAESFKKDPVTRVKNNYAGNAISATNQAITNQNNLSYDVNDQLAEIGSSEAATNKFIDSNVSGGGSRVASRMANRGQSIRNRNQVFGERNRMNTGFKQTANNMLLNKANLLTGLGTEDAQYENMYREGILQRDANLRKNRYSALSNMSNVGQQFNRDQELMDLLPLMFPNAKLTR